MGKWIVIIGLCFGVWIGFRFARFGIMTAELSTAATELLASIEEDGDDRSIQAFAAEARGRGFEVDPASVTVSIGPARREPGVARFVPETVARIVRREVRLTAPVRYRVAGPLVRHATIDVSDIRSVEVMGASSVDANPELARELGIATPDGPPPAPHGAGENASSTRRARGVYGGALQRARDVAR